MNFIAKLKKAFAGPAAKQRVQARTGEKRYRNAMIEFEMQREMQIQQAVEAGISHAMTAKFEKQQEQACTEEKKRLLSVIETMGDGILHATKAPQTAHFTRKN
ncbi:MAG TPA: hypothetical protein VEF76_07895 [Patescibacteria group bacterium]|nr:hypothetical protein [Patescibacteria group bacterium]